MTRYRLWFAPVLAWFHAGFYDDVGRRHRGVGALLLLGILALATTLQVAFMAWTYISSVQDPNFQATIDMIPPFRIEQGVVSSPVAQPWIRQDATDPNEVFWLGLDTTGTITDIPPDVAGGVLVTARDLRFTDRRPGKRQRSEVVPLAEVESFEFGPDIARSWVSLAGTIGIPIVGVIHLFASWTLRFVLAVVVGLFLRAGDPSRTLTSEAAIRLAVVGMIPTLLLTMIYGWTGLFSDWYFIVWWSLFFLSAPWWALGVRSLYTTDDPTPAQG